VGVCGCVCAGERVSGERVVEARAEGAEDARDGGVGVTSISIGTSIGIGVCVGVCEGGGEDGSE
jgi:hypothetical protein